MYVKIPKAFVSHVKNIVSQKQKIPLQVCKIYEKVWNNSTKKFEIYPGWFDCVNSSGVDISAGILYNVEGQMHLHRVDKSLIPSLLIQKVGQVRPWDKDANTTHIKKDWKDKIVYD